MLHRARRTLIAFGTIASFFLAVASDAYGLHDCPHHDGVASPPPAGASADESDAHAPAHSHRGANHPAGDHADHPAPSVHFDDAGGGHDGHTAVCICVGDCAGGGGSAPLPGSAVLPRVSDAPAPPRSVAPRHVLPGRLEPPDYLQPPAIGPPAS